MKDKKVSLGKLNLNKMTISSLESVKGGKMLEEAGTSINTRFTGVKTCCSGQWYSIGCR